MGHPQFYVETAGEILGPVDAVELKRMAKSKKITALDRVRKGEDGRWVTAIDVKGLFDTVEATSLPVPHQAPATTTKEYLPEWITPAPTPIPTPMPTRDNADRKACPFCGELVLAIAKKCKHCGETLDVALRAAEEAKRLALATASSASVSTNVSTTVIVNQARRRYPHGWFIFLTIITGGWFAVFYIPHFILCRRNYD